jgi:ribosome modulation factor
LGTAIEKKRRNRDALDRAEQKSAIDGWSAGVAKRIDALVPSRKINRPDSAASCVGTGI